MSSIYKYKGIYYFQLTINYKTIKRSLRTKDKRIAKQRAKELEPQLYRELSNPAAEKFIHYNDLVKLYLKGEHEWSIPSRKTCEYVLNLYKLNVALPENKATRIGVQGRINAVINWGKKKGYVTNRHKYSLQKKPARTRVYTDMELISILKNTVDNNFKRFVQFAYYTGARRGELCNLQQQNIYQKYFKTHGKTGNRIVRLNEQAREILQKQNTLWRYETDYVTKHFKKNLRRLGIPNGQFHDLRRTFGLNLIKAGYSIFKVSKLLGHTSIRTTESHYAPLMVTDIEDFKL